MPVTWQLVLYSWKDTSLAIAALLLICYGLRIFVTKGKWLNQGKFSIGKVVLLAVFFAIATIVRHNAILFTLPLLAAVLVYITRKRRVQLIVCTLILMILVKGPLYGFLGVEKPGDRNIEMLGLPLTMIGSVIRNEPESLDEQTRSFIYTLASQEDWNKYYVTGNFNSIKYSKFNDKALEKAGMKKTLYTTWKCLQASPKQALYGMFKLTSHVYGIVGTPRIYLEIGISSYDESINIAFKHPFLVKVFNKGNIILVNIFGIISSFVGIINFLIILVYLGKCRLKKKESLKKALLCLPLLCYNFGTMLLLSTPDDYRFFYLSVPIFPILLFWLLTDDDWEKQT